MNFQKKRREQNLKQLEAASQYLRQKGFDLENLPPIQHHHPLIKQRQQLFFKLDGTANQDEQSQDSFLLNQYWKHRQSRDNNERKQQNQSNTNGTKLLDNKQQRANKREFEWQQYAYGFNASKKEGQQKPKNQKKNMVIQKAPSLLSLKQQNSKNKYMIVTEEHKKCKIKIEDVFGKQQPLRINYEKADVKKWENYKKNQDFRLEYVLKNFPNIKSFKNNQKAIIKCALQNTNIFVCMPTGGGKSLTFQVLTFLNKGIYICVMPLISLIFDQEMQAKKMGIEAYSMTANTSQSEYKFIYQKLNSFREIQNSIVIFCTPEKLNLSQQFSDILETIYQRGQLKRIVIDEVHCVSTWGKDFRIEYQNLSTLKKRFPKTPILALTATVTEVVKQDIISRLGIEGCYFFQSSFNRPNLFYQVRNKDKNILQQIQKIIQRYKNQAGLIYCLSKKDCQQTCFKLSKRGYRIAYYHADIDEQEKKGIQERWMRNEINIIVATIAFGMGINKPDVRFVIHHTMSKSLQNYYQQSGRAGRDSQFSVCIIFYRKQDKQFLQSMNLKNEFSTLARKQFTTKQLAEMIKYCEDRSKCRRKFQLDYLGQTDFDSKFCNKTCDNCRQEHIFLEYECIDQAKALIKVLLQMQNSKISLSRNQLIDLIRGKGQKGLKYKISQIQRVGIDLQDLKMAFIGWKQNELESLIVDLMSYQILQQKVFKSLIVRNNKENEVMNVHVKCDIAKSKVFLNKVQTFPFRRNTQKQTAKEQIFNIPSISEDQFVLEERQNTETVLNQVESEESLNQVEDEDKRNKKIELYQKLLEQIYECQEQAFQ